MTRCCFVLCLALPAFAVPAASAQAHPHGFTVGFRGALAFPRVGRNADFVYHGDVQVSWQGDAGFRIAPRLALGVEAVFNRTPEFAGDCISTCAPSPDYSAFSGVVT